jgi:hypothetical protein
MKDMSTTYYSEGEKYLVLAARISRGKNSNPRLRFDPSTRVRQTSGSGDGPSVAVVMKNYAGSLLRCIEAL